MKTIHLKPGKEHRCKECGKCFGMEGNLCIHMNGWVVDLEMRKTLMETGMWIIILTENQSQ